MMKVFLINIFWFVSSIKNVMIYKYACFNVRARQKRNLKEILQNNTESLFGKRHKFHRIQSIEDWQKNIPLSDYEDYSDYVDEIRIGHKNVLCEEDVFLLEPTSGSSGANKLIPYTKGLQKQFQKAIDPWIFNLIIKKPKILIGKQYWAISPNNKLEIDSKVPVGFASDEEYLSTFTKRFLKNIKPVPSEVKEIDNLESFWYVSLFFLLKAKSLSLISAWHPSWLEILLSKLDLYSDKILEDIYKGELSPPNGLGDELKNKLYTYIKPDKKRSEELRLIFDSLKSYKQVWPNLQVISLWEDRHNTGGLKKLKEKFPNVLFQHKGLIATEGIISFPSIGSDDFNLAISSHFFEFRFIGTKDDLGNREPGKEVLVVHQLKKEYYYEVIITTAGGLYRYKLGDIIKVVGFNKKCPLIKFIGRSNMISDICGEKLNEVFVMSILRKLLIKYKIESNFVMLAPVKKAEKLFYTLFVEKVIKEKEVLDRLQKDLDHDLRKNYHYENCRKLGQLSNTKVFMIKEKASKVYIERMREGEMSIGDIKPTNLSKQLNWDLYFDGNFL